MLTLLALGNAACSNSQTAGQPDYSDTGGETLVAPAEYSVDDEQRHHMDDYLPESYGTKMMRSCFQFGVSGCASPALLVQRTKGRNVTWDETNLDEYLRGPGKFARGTKMVYFVPNEKDRQDMIAYVKALSR
jgi:hypothetical protein